MTQFSINQTSSQFFQCVAVSTTSDATGTYRRFAYSFHAASTTTRRCGVWPDGYYITFNMFNAAGTAFAGCARVRVRPQPDAHRVRHARRDPVLPALAPPTAGSCRPTSTDHAAAGRVAELRRGVRRHEQQRPQPLEVPRRLGERRQLHVHGPGHHHDRGLLARPVGGGTCIPQPSTTQQLDSLADRLMYPPGLSQLRRSTRALVVNHSVTAGTAASGVRWYEIRSPGGTPTVFQQGTYSPDATSRWMGSIAQDQQGNMLLGYSVSSSTVRPGIRYTGRLAERRRPARCRRRRRSSTGSRVADRRASAAGATTAR